MTREAAGFLFIGDPHLASRNPGFRKDDYPAAIMGKLRALLNHAREEDLVPVLLGDLFHYPRDNANWMLTELISLLAMSNVYTVAGNHDCSENVLNEHDTLSVLEAAGVLTLLERSGPQDFRINGTPVRLGGTQWGALLPEWIDNGGGLGVWVFHHDLAFPEYHAARHELREIPGIDVAINGHIHRPLPQQRRGSTTWLNPGNIARVNRSDASREKKPMALRLDVSGGEWSTETIEVPHDPFDDVFHEAVSESAEPDTGSVFVKGLEELITVGTEDGSALRAFLDKNLEQFPEEVAAEINTLAEEVLDNAQQG